MNYEFKILGDIRNFSKSEFSNLLDILGQCGIDNFGELVKLYESTFKCNRHEEKLKKEQEILLNDKKRLEEETDEVNKKLAFVNKFVKDNS